MYWSFLQIYFYFYPISPPIQYSISSNSISLYLSDSNRVRAERGELHQLLTAVGSRLIPFGPPRQVTDGRELRQHKIFNNPGIYIGQTSMQRVHGIPEVWRIFLAAGNSFYQRKSLSVPPRKFGATLQKKCNQFRGFFVGESPEFFICTYNRGKDM